VVIIKTNLTTGKSAKVLLFSDDLELAYDKQYLRQKLGSPGVNSADFCGLENSVVD